MRSVYDRGPVAVLINGDSLSSSNYINGVFSDPSCSTSLDHTVVIVGWGTQPANGSTPAINYWIMKNSWGSSWGQNGFFLIQRGLNMCGINEWVYFPIMTAANAKPYNYTCSSG
jgi:C1A family cysteine protease